MELPLLDMAGVHFLSTTPSKPISDQFGCVWSELDSPKNKSKVPEY